MVNKIALWVCLALPGYCYAAADTLPPSRPDSRKIAIVAGANALVWTGSFLLLDQAWYADYPRTSFHFFNDNAEWNQMDKAGHMWTTYHISRLSTRMWKWTGLQHNTSAVLGGVSGMVYQAIVELQDAYAVDWGFSWGDMGGNALGAGIYVLQELGWKDQRLTVKMSYWPASHPPVLENRVDALFGKSVPERILKDYNAQTYWVSANLSSFFPRSELPPWLSISVGYGSRGMYGGRSNIWTDREGIEHDYSQIDRERLFYLAPDIDLTRIRTNRKFLKGLLYVLNMVKVPAPALQLSSNGKLSLKAVHF